MIPTSTSRLLLPLLLVTSLAAQGPILQGNLVVVRLGDGIAPLVSGAATPVFLDQYTPGGTLMSTIPLPTAASGSNQAFTNSSTATSEGILNLSADGQYLLCAGYTAVPGITGIAATTSAATPRVVARVDLAGNVDTSSTLGTAFSGGNPRSVTSPDGVQLYVGGQNSGINYSIFGSGTTLQLNSTPTNTRVVRIENGQLYFSAQTGTFLGVSTLGTGLPTTNGQIAALLVGMGAAGTSSYDFWFADANTLYVADDRLGSAGGGIQKWTQSAGTWTLAYTLAPATNLGCRGLTGENLCGVVTLYATATQASANTLVSVVDTGAGSTFTTLATAATNTVFRGIRRIAAPAQATVVGVGSPSVGGIATIGVTSAPRIGDATFGFTSSNFPSFGVGALVIKFGFLVPGYQIPGAQPGALAYINPPEDLLYFMFADGAGNATQVLGIPCNPGFIGLPAGAQIVVIDASLQYPLQFATSPAMQLIVGS